MVEYEKFKKSLKRLEEQYQNFLKIKSEDTISVLTKEAVRESVIQRFETCYDTIWKHLKKYLEIELGLPDVPNSPKPIFRLVNENNLHLELEKWFEYGQARIDTSHDYSEEKAKVAIELVNDFIKDAIPLYETISKEKWEH